MLHLYLTGKKNLTCPLNDIKWILNAMGDTLRSNMWINPIN